MKGLFALLGRRLYTVHRSVSSGPTSGRSDRHHPENVSVSELPRLSYLPHHKHVYLQPTLLTKLSPKCEVFFFSSRHESVVSQSVQRKSDNVYKDSVNYLMHSTSSQPRVSGITIRAVPYFTLFYFYFLLCTTVLSQWDFSYGKFSPDVILCG